MTGRAQVPRTASVGGMGGCRVRRMSWCGNSHGATEAASVPDPACCLPTMKLATALFCLGCVLAARGHGDHGHDAPAKGETIQQYAQRHVRWIETTNSALSLSNLLFS